MKYFFEDPGQQKKLKAVLESWLNTPWRHKCGIKGLGCDCIHFGIRVYEQMGLVKWRDDLVPDYPQDWHLHNTRELLKEAIEREVQGEWVDKNDPMNGDVILTHYGKASSHAGIFFDGYVYQSITGIGVRKVRYKIKVFGGEIKYAFRPFGVSG
jgi:cell wall-associated NlpC family hydrolase